MLNIVQWTLGFDPGGLRFLLGLQLISSITSLKSLSRFTPLLNLWEGLCNHEMNIPVISIVQTTALSRAERNKFQSLLFPFWTNPS